MARGTFPSNRLRSSGVGDQHDEQLSTMKRGALTKSSGTQNAVNVRNKFSNDPEFYVSFILWVFWTTDSKLSRDTRGLPARKKEEEEEEEEEEGKKRL